MKDHHKIIGGFMFFMILLFIAWVISGGPMRAMQNGSDTNKFIDAAAPIGSGQTYNKTNQLPPISNPNQIVP